jgi:adenosylhomocysteine nucleosidase
MGEIAVFTALRLEVSPLKTLLGKLEQVSREIPIYIGQREGKNVILVRSGVGTERSLAAAEFMHARYKPEGVLSTGFCGGLVPKLRTCDVVVGRWVVSDTAECPRNATRLVLGRQVWGLHSALRRQGIRVHIGGIACVSRPVISPGERLALAHRTGAMIAEMETFPLAAFFIGRNVPFLGMRTVLDGLEDRIPRLESIMRTVHWPDALNALWHLLRPRGGLWSLYETGRRAQVVLRESVAAVIRVWP